MSLIEVKIDGTRRWVSEGKGKCAELWVNGRKLFPPEKVPVVSVEWLKEYCRKMNKSDKKNWTRTGNEKYYGKINARKNLLQGAYKQIVRKQAKAVEK